MGTDSGIWRSSSAAGEEIAVGDSGQRIEYVDPIVDESEKMIERFDFGAVASTEILEHSGHHPYLLELVLFELVEAIETGAAVPLDTACIAAAARYRSYWDRSLRLLQDDSPGSVDRPVQTGSGVLLDTESRETDFPFDMSLIARSGDGYCIAAGALGAHLREV